MAALRHSVRPQLVGDLADVPHLGRGLPYVARLAAVGA